MKKCKECGEVKSSDKFSVQSKSEKYTNGIRYNTVCKICMNAKQRAYRNKMTKLIGRWKQMKGCTQCGYKEHFAALHLAHWNKSEKTTPGKGAIKKWWSKTRVKEELAKCRVLCSNCHAVETYQNKDYLPQ